MELIDAFDSAFQTTQVQVRYPHWYAVGANQCEGFGLHDDSFAHSTIDEGVYGSPMDWFFWSTVVNVGSTDFWMTGAMGGEMRPEIQKTIFHDTYPWDVCLNNSCFLHVESLWLWDVVHGHCP